MEKKQIEIIVCVVGVIVFIFVIFGNKFTGGKNSTPKALKSTDAIADSFNKFDENLTLIAHKEINDSIEKLVNQKAQSTVERDPFEILVSTEIEVVEIVEEEKIPERPEFLISGIVFGDANTESSVIIDNEFYTAGQNIDGWEIVLIENERVVFQSGDIEYVFNLYTSVEEG